LNNTLIGTNLTDWNASDGYYNITVMAGDDEENSSNSTVRHFRLDTTGPSWSVNKTNSSLAKINNNITFNITVSDYGSGLSYFIFSWNGSGKWENNTNWSISGGSHKLVINKSTNLSGGNVIGYRWYANDSLNNWNNSILRLFTVLNTPPNAPTISYPEDNKNYTDIPYINYSAVDVDGDALTYFVFINNSLNYTGIELNLTDWNASDGYYNITVMAGDDEDNSSNSSVRHFRLDTLGPSFSGNKTNASITLYSGGTIQINITITDNGAGLAYYALSHNDTADETWTNTSFIGINATSVNPIFNYTIQEFSSGGTFGWQVWANDTAGNSNASTIRTFLVTASDSCSCPDSGDWHIIDGDQCTLESDCNLGSNNFRVLNGAMTIPSGLNIRASGCYVAGGQILFIEDGGGLYCEE